MDKRFLLLAGLAVLAVFAGCIDAEATASFEPVTAEEVAERTSVSMKSLDPDIERAITGNVSEPTTATLPYDVEEYGYPVAYNGSYYALEQERAGTVGVTSVGVDARRVSGSANTDLGDLSQTDRRTVLNAIDAAQQDEDLRIGAGYEGDERNQSVLLERETVRVEADGETYEVTIIDREQRRQETYTYTATQIAPNTTVYGERIIDEYAFTLEEAPNGSETIINESPYYGEETEAFTALWERFQQEEELEGGEHYGIWLTRYDGQLYWVRLST